MSTVEVPISEQAKGDNTYTSFDQLPLFLDVPTLAAALGIGLSSAYALVRSGQVPSIKVGKQYRIPRDRLRNLISGEDN